jgi:leader peptidase (prepilin peptidase)/N-methyltransferase
MTEFRALLLAAAALPLLSGAIAAAALAGPGAATVAGSLAGTAAGVLAAVFATMLPALIEGRPVSDLSERPRDSVRAIGMGAALGAAVGHLALSPALAFAGAVCVFGLFLLATVDLKALYLPDVLMLPLALIGLGLAVAGLGFVDPVDAVVGGVVGWGGLKLLAVVHARLRGEGGLGMGDVNLLGVLGLWLGVTALPPLLLLAAVTGGVLVVAGQGRDAGELGEEAPEAGGVILPLGVPLAIAALPFILARTAGLDLAALALGLEGAWFR